MGGIVGTNEVQSTGMKNIYNTGAIKSYELKRVEQTQLYLAGICGLNKSKIEIGYNANTKIETDYCIRISHITTKYDDEKNATCVACYYLPDKLYIRDELVVDDLNLETGKSESYMKSTDFVDELNKNNDNIWKQDTNNINDGYPIFSWQ